MKHGLARGMQYIYVTGNYAGQENGGEKMKLTVAYWLKASGDIGFNIHVADEGDFPEQQIFTRCFDPEPGVLLESFDSDTERSSSVVGFHRTPAEVKELVKLHVAKIQEMLEKWRAIKVPADEEYEL